jgi:hypothetical protein
LGDGHVDAAVHARRTVRHAMKAALHQTAVALVRSHVQRVVQVRGRRRHRRRRRPRLVQRLQNYAGLLRRRLALHVQQARRRRRLPAAAKSDGMSCWLAPVGYVHNERFFREGLFTRVRFTTLLTHRSVRSVAAGLKSHRDARSLAGMLHCQRVRCRQPPLLVGRRRRPRSVLSREQLAQGDPRVDCVLHVARCKTQSRNAVNCQLSIANCQLPIINCD